MYEKVTRYLDPARPGERRFGHWIDELAESGLAHPGYWETCERYGLLCGRELRELGAAEVADLDEEAVLGALTWIKRFSDWCNCAPTDEQERTARALLKRLRAIDEVRSRP